jgi:DUF4097 and DUF4098 domain-containing protein YvlB
MNQTTKMKGIMNKHTTLLCFVLPIAWVLTSGCIISRANYSKTVLSEVPHINSAGLYIHTSNGAINVQQSDTEKVEITATLHALSAERLDAVEIIAERTGSNTLEIYAKWPDKRKHNEKCSFNVLLPNASSVHLKTSNGDIKCLGLSGEGLLESSNGDIIVSTHGGPLDAHTDNGEITARNITGSVSLKTSNGDIKAYDVNAPFNMTTSNGDIYLELAPAFEGEIKASTSNGKLDTKNLNDAQLISCEKNRVHLKVGHETNCSKIRTSNGAVCIRPAQQK